MKLKYDVPLSNVAFKFNLRRYSGGVEAVPVVAAGAPGRAVQVEPIKPMLKALETKRLKLQYDEPPSNFALKFNLRRYTLLSYRLYDPLLAVAAVPTQSRRILALASLLVGWCRLTVSKPVLEVPMISALETVM